MSKTIQNNVEKLRTITVDEFFALNFNTLKDPKRNVVKLKNSIRKNGWSFPVFIWAGHDFVIDGAGRKIACKELLEEGYQIKEIPVVEIKAKTLKEAKAKVLEVSSQYGDVTKDSFMDFTDGMDLDFDTFEIGGINADMFIEEDEKDDEVPEAPEEPVSKLGDLYELGGHRVLCGDSTKLEDVEKLMDGQKADMVFTDPPYNVDYNGKGKNTSNKILNDKMSDSVFLQFITDAMFTLEKISKKTASWYVCHSHKAQNEFELGIETTKRDVKTQIIWVKPSATLGWQEYRTQHELIFYAVHRDEKTKFYGYRTLTTVWKSEPDDNTILKWAKRLIETDMKGTSTIWRVKRDNVNEYTHPTQKPTELIVRAIANSSKRNDIVVDTFLGSGSTLIASEKSERKCYGMELDPKYADIIVQRYVNFTGNTTIKKNGKEIVWNVSE
jgi:DNA modification methylase